VELNVFLVEVSIGLPFFLRLEDSFPMRYEAVCKEARLPELEGQDVHHDFTETLGCN